MSNLIADICQRLAEVFAYEIPLYGDSNKPDRQRSSQQIEQATRSALQRFYDRAHEERQRHGLGIISRARVAFGLQQRLLQMGYPPEVVKPVLFALLTAAFVGDRVSK